MSFSSSSQPASSLFTGISSPSDLSWVDKDGTAHERCKLLTFLGPNFLGESPIDPGDCPELGYRRVGTAYFCSVCGEVWGRLVLVGPNGGYRAFEVVQISCEKHFDQWNIAGSFLGGYRNEGYLKYLPLAAVQREFLIHLRQGVEI